MKPLIATVAIIASLLAGQALAENSVTIVIEDHHPGSWSDSEGNMRGHAIDAVRAIMSRAALPYELKILPWQRVYGQTLETPNVCAFGVAITDKRRDLFKWARPLSFNDMSLYAVETSTIAIKSIEDVRRLGLTIGVEVGDISEVLIEETGGLKYEGVTNRMLNVKKLAAGHIDLWATGPLSADFAETNAGLHLRPLLKLTTFEVGIACNLKTPDETVARIDTALADMRQDGTLDAIWRKKRTAGGEGSAGEATADARTLRRPRQ